MPDNNFDLQNHSHSTHSRVARRPTKLLEIARIHHIEAKQLRQHALDAQAEERRKRLSY